MAKQVLINSIKKDTKIVFDDGTPGIVADNAKGLIRNVKVPRIFSPGEWDGPSSCYAYEWKTTEIDGEIYEVALTEAQAEQSGRIRKIMRAMSS